MRYRAIHRYADMSPRKVRPVAALIRGRMADEALELLKYTKKRACTLVDKVLRTAMADADEQEANVKKLFVHEARVDCGPTIKRFQPKDRGRAHSILKRTSHIVVTVGEGPRK